MDRKIFAKKLAKCNVSAGFSTLIVVCFLSVNTISCYSGKNFENTVFFVSL